MELMKEVAAEAGWSDPFPDLSIVERPGQSAMSSEQQAAAGSIAEVGLEVEDGDGPDEDAIEPFLANPEPVEELLEKLAGEAGVAVCGMVESKMYICLVLQMALLLTICRKCDLMTMDHLQFILNLLL